MRARSRERQPCRRGPTPSEPLGALLWLRSAAKSWAAAPARTPVRVMPCSGPACGEGCVSSGNPQIVPAPALGGLAYAFFPSLRSGKGGSPPNPSPPPLKAPPCFLLVS